MCNNINNIMPKVTRKEFIYTLEIVNVFDLQNSKFWIENHKEWLQEQKL